MGLDASDVTELDKWDEIKKIFVSAPDDDVTLSEVSVIEAPTKNSDDTIKTGGNLK